jgi:hypothetical protein
MPGKYVGYKRRPAATQKQSVQQEQSPRTYQHSRNKKESSKRGKRQLKTSRNKESFEKLLFYC